MKFYRRHKHELNHTETDDPLPQVPEKKMRYSRADDVLLAKFFFNKPDGTSDKIFQAFGRLVSLLTVLFYCCFRSVITFSTHITHGRVGRNTIGFISRRLTTLFNGLAKVISLTNPIRQLSRERGETSFFFSNSDVHTIYATICTSITSICEDADICSWAVALYDDPGSRQRLETFGTF